MVPQDEEGASAPGAGQDLADVVVLSQLSGLFVQAQKRFSGRGSARAKCYLLDDFLFVVMREGMTTAESTMVGFGKHDLVRGFRQEIEKELDERLVPQIEALTGRTIVNFQSQILFDPHLVVSIFFFEPGPGEGLDDDAEGELPED